jgi:type III pantothenate kinase
MNQVAILFGFVQKSIPLFEPLPKQIFKIISYFSPNDKAHIQSLPLPMKILTIDAGNSTLAIGLFYQGELAFRWTLPTLKNENLGMYFDQMMSQYFIENQLLPQTVEAIVLSSVVPELNSELTKACQQLFPCPITWVQPEWYTRLPLDFVNPLEMGSDIVCNMVQAYYQIQKQTLIVDFGTALTYALVSEEGKALGVAIAPGIKTAVNALFSNTAQLPIVTIEVPDSSLGMDTISAIQSGIFHGYEGMIRHMIQKIKGEFGATHTVATGGLSGLLKGLQGDFDTLDPNFTLRGIHTFFEKTRQPSL